MKQQKNYWELVFFYNPGHNRCECNVYKCGHFIDNQYEVGDDMENIKDYMYDILESNYGVKEGDEVVRIYLGN